MMPIRFRTFNNIEQVFVPSAQRDDGSFDGRWEPVSYLQKAFGWTVTTVKPK